MLLTADVGNTNTKISLVDGYNVISTLTLANRENPISKNSFLSKIFQKNNSLLQNYYQTKIKDFIKEHKADNNIEGSIIASVVPNISESLIEAIKESTNTSPITFKDEDFNMGVNVQEHLRNKVGQDLVAIGYGGYIISNAVANGNFSLTDDNKFIISPEYNKTTNTKINPVIIICSGTATTTTMVNGNGDLMVASIATGIEKSNHALFSGAALLKDFDIINTEPKINETFGCIVNGQAVIQTLGHKIFAEKMNKEYLDNNPNTLKLITGGAAPLFAKYINDAEPKPDMQDRSNWYHITNLIPIGLAGLYYINKNDTALKLGKKKDAKISAPQV